MVSKYRCVELIDYAAIQTQVGHIKLKGKRYTRVIPRHYYYTLQKWRIAAKWLAMSSNTQLSNAHYLA